MELHAGAFFICAHRVSGVGTYFGFGVPLNAPQHKEEDRVNPVLLGEIANLSSVDDIGVFGVVAQAVDW